MTISPSHQFGYKQTSLIAGLNRTLVMDCRKNFLPFAFFFVPSHVFICSLSLKGNIVFDLDDDLLSWRHSSFHSIFNISPGGVIVCSAEA